MIRLLGLGLLAAGAINLAVGCWLPAKAALAQVLLRSAWSRTQAGEERVRPWPWARHWPVARLRAPRLRVDEIVLAGTEGASLAFGPGHLDGTALPGTVGNAALAGHRDTHFRFLAELALGDALEVETPGGERLRYRVVATRVVRADQTSVLAPTAGSALTLVTCYPFDAVRPGTPWRYVVRAELVGAAAAVAQRHDA